MRTQLAQREAKGDPPNELFELHCRNLRKIHDAGMVIGMGTDGTGDGFGAHEQIEAYTRCGMTPMEAIVAATGTNARVLHLDRMGTVAAGKEASFNVLDAQPLENITNTRRISRIYLRGKELDRQALRTRFMTAKTLGCDPLTLLDRDDRALRVCDRTRTGADLSAGNDSKRRRKSRRATPPSRLEEKNCRPGSGTVKEGATVYAQKCQACHGANGTGTKLHRGLIPLGNAKPVKIQGSLVPYATTVWDFINRAMPTTKPGSLTPDEVYAVTAYVLFLNEVIEENDVLDATTLPKIKMPNRDNFLAVETRLETRTATAARLLPVRHLTQLGILLPASTVPAGKKRCRPVIVPL